MKKYDAKMKTTLGECIEAMERHGYMSNEKEDMAIWKRLAFASGYIREDCPEISNFLWKILQGEDA